MIEIRLDENYDRGQLKFILEKIKNVAPEELTYGVEADVGMVDVNVGDVKTPTTHMRYERYSEAFPNVLWVVIFESSYIGYWQGERFGGDSLDEIIYDMFA